MNEKVVKASEASHVDNVTAGPGAARRGRLWSTNTRRWRKTLVCLQIGLPGASEPSH